MFSRVGREGEGVAGDDAISENSREIALDVVLVFGMG